MENNLSNIRFSEGLWPDLLFVAGITGKFLLSFTPALLLIIFLSYYYKKQDSGKQTGIIWLILAVTVYSGLSSLSRLEYSLESFSYMLAAVSGVFIVLLIAYYALVGKKRIRNFLLPAFLCGWLAGEIALVYHQEIEKITYFSDKAISYLASHPDGIATVTGGENFALISFSLYIGLAEEFFKFLFLIIPFYAFLRRGNRVDIFLLTIFSAAGFAAFENIIYAFNYGVNISLIRNLFNGHIFFALWTAPLLAVIAGIANRRAKSEFSYILLLFPLYILLALLHGVWDFVSVKLAGNPALSYMILGGAYLCSLGFVFHTFSRELLSDKKINQETTIPKQFTND